MTWHRTDRIGLVKATLFGSAFLGYIVPLLMPLFVRDIARDIGVDVAVVGFMAGLQGLTVGLASLVVGPLSDRYGRKPVLSWSLLLNGVAVIAFSTAWDSWSLYAFGTLSAITFSPLVFCALAYIGDYFAPEKRGATVGLVSAAVYGGVIIGTPLAVLLIETPQFGWRSVFLVIGVLSFAVGAQTQLSLKAISTGNEDKRVELKPIVTNYWSFARTPHLREFLAIFFLLRMGVGMYLVYGAAYLLVSREFPMQGYLIVYPFGGALAFAASMVAGKLTDKIGARPLIFVASLTIIASILMIVHVPTTPSSIVTVMVILCAMYMVSESIRMAALQTEAVSKVATQSRGAFLGATSFLMHIGYAAGALFGGLALGIFKNTASVANNLAVGYTFIVYVAATLWFIAMILALYNTRFKPAAASTMDAEAAVTPADR